MKVSRPTGVGRRTGMCILLVTFAIAFNALKGNASDGALYDVQPDGSSTVSPSNVGENVATVSFTSEGSDNSPYLVQTAAAAAADISGSFESSLNLNDVTEKHVLGSVQNLLQHGPDRPESYTGGDETAPAVGERSQAHSRRLHEGGNVASEEIGELVPPDEAQETLASALASSGPVQHVVESRAHETDSVSSGEEAEVAVNGPDRRRFERQALAEEEQERLASTLGLSGFVQHLVDSLAEDFDNVSRTGEEAEAPVNGADRRRLAGAALADEDTSTTEVPEISLVGVPQVKVLVGSEIRESTNVQEKMESFRDEREENRDAAEPADEIAEEDHMEDEESVGFKGFALEPAVKPAQPALPARALRRPGQTQGDATVENAGQLEGLSLRWQLDGKEDEMKMSEGDAELALTSGNTEVKQGGSVRVAQHDNFAAPALREGTPVENVNGKEGIVAPTQEAVSLRRRLAEEGSSSEQDESSRGEACGCGQCGDTDSQIPDGSYTEDDSPVDDVEKVAPNTKGHLRGTAVAQEEVSSSDEKADGATAAATI